VAYFAAGSLLDLMYNTFRDKRTADLKRELAVARVLFIDDFQLFANERHYKTIGDFLFQLVDYLLASGRCVVVTSDVRPSAEMWPAVPERLRHRITLAGAVEVTPPDEDFTMAYLEHGFSRHGLSVEPEALREATKFYVTSVRDLRRVVMYIVARGYSSVTPDVVRRAFAEALGMAEPVSEKTLLAVVIRSLFPQDEAERLLSAMKSRRPPRNLAWVKAALAHVMSERGASVSTLSRVLHIVPSAVYRWLESHREYLSDPSYGALVERVAEIVEKTGGAS